MKNKTVLYGLIGSSAFLLLTTVTFAGLYVSKQVTSNSPVENQATTFVSDLAEVNEEDFVHLQFDPSETGEISDSEAQDLQYMREEEKLARDVYQELYDIWGQRIFDNISKSEQTHTDSIKSLLELYNIDDPVVSDARGEFTNQEFTDLYNDLVETGKASLVDALKVGATIEDLDIFDLNERLERTSNENIITVYENLNRGSRNHIRSFSSMLLRNGEEYTPQFISEEEYLEIIASPNERGGGQNHGGSSSNGNGNGGGGRGRNR